eukprot:gene6671-9017_t
MTTKTVTGALTSPQTITNDFDTWVVASDSTINVASGNAIVDTSSVTGRVLQIAGDLSAALGSGANLQGDNYDITVADGSVITAKYGVVLSGTGSTVTNDGDISASTVGIYEDGGSDKIVNNGTLSGFYGVELDGVGSSLVNGKDGVIDGGGSPIWFGNTTGKTTFTNDGIVKGGTQSMAGDAGTTVVINHGTIEQQIYLGDGNDTFINQGGICKGNVDLEHGSDLYVIDKASIKINESDAGDKGDVDTVKASVAYTLGANIENLVLTG